MVRAAVDAGPDPVERPARARRAEVEAGRRQRTGPRIGRRRDVEVPEILPAEDVLEVTPGVAGVVADAFVDDDQKSKASRRR